MLKLAVKVNQNQVFVGHFRSFPAGSGHFPVNENVDMFTILGPNGWPRFNNNKFKYLAEIVEHKLVLDGDFDTYRFTIKFQSGGSEYALTFDPQTEAGFQTYASRSASDWLISKRR